MPLGRKHLRRIRDAPTGGMGLQRTTSILRRKWQEVKCRLLPNCQFSVPRKSILALCFRTDPGRHGVQPDTGSPLEMVIGDDEMDLAGSLTEVAVKVTAEPLGTAPGAW